MKAIRFLVAVALAVAWFAPPAGANDAQVTEEERLSDRLLELTISTPAFAEPTKVHVFLPTGYRDDRSSRWPVTYFTAGTMNNHNSFANVVGGEGLTADYPSIVVSPDSNSGYWSDWFNNGALGPPMYETFVIEQLIPLIDQRFRTLSSRAHRLTFGISMGGYGSLMFAARHPDKFAAAATLSGAVDSNLPANGAVLSLSSTFDGAEPDAIYGPRLTEEVRWRGHNPWDLAANLRGLDLQVRTANGILNPAIGEGGTPDHAASCVVEGGVHMASTSLHDKLESLDIDHAWQDYGPGCHTPQNFTREIVDTLAAFEPVLADPPSRPRRFSYSSIEPRFKIWRWAIRADQDRALEFMRMKRAGRRGLTLTGSGETRVKTPPFFRGVQAVEVTTSDGSSETLGPSRRGRLRFTVDLGTAHPNQQYTVASQLAGEGSDGYFTEETVSFTPSRR